MVDPIAATKPGAPVVWEDAPDNIAAAMSYGDAAAVEAAFARAAHVVSLDLVSQRLVPSAMEPRSTIAEVDKKSGRLMLHMQSQTPGSTRDMLAEAVLKRPKESVRVLVGDIGGGFGQKTSLYPEDGIVAYAAVKLAARCAGAASAPTSSSAAPMAAISPRPANSRSTPKAACRPIGCVRSAAPGPISPAPAPSSRWCSVLSCNRASTTCRWCITRSRRS